MKETHQAARVATKIIAMLAAAGPAYATEGFEPRYNMAGALGGELFAPPQQSGWIGGLATTRISVSKVTGDDGRALTVPVAGGSVALPAPLPASMYPSYAVNLAQVAGTGTLIRWDLVIGYLGQQQVGGARLVWLVDLPYGRKEQSFIGRASTPGLNWNPAVPAPVQAAVQGQFAGQYQAGLAAQNDGASGTVSGQGDLELQGGWLYETETWRVLAGAALVLPTGAYGPSLKPDIGSGNLGFEVQWNGKPG